jgi:hypothetical protein
LFQHVHRQNNGFWNFVSAAFLAAAGSAVNGQSGNSNSSSSSSSNSLSNLLHDGSHCPESMWQQHRL